MISNRPKIISGQSGATLVSRGPGRWSGVAAGCAAIATTLASGSALATENFGLRYAPGIGGGDMSAPLDPGWYGQIAVFAYSAGKVKGSPQGSLQAGPVKAIYDTDAKISVQGLFPRITYISTEKVLNANIGFTALFPLINQKVESSAVLTSTSSATLDYYHGLNPAIPTGATVNAQLAGTSADEDHKGSKFSLGDIELAPIMRWSMDAHQVVFIPAILLGTGDFKAGRAYNPGSGKYSTFRPTVQYSYIGEGWDFGIRAAYSISGRNKDTEYRSGNTWNIDWAAMKFINDATRIGLQGYVIYQATEDSVKSAAEGGQSMYTNRSAAGVYNPIALGKGRAFAAGPAVSWIKDSGTLLLEGKVLKEFSVENRPEGTAAWLTLSKPLP